MEKKILILILCFSFLCLGSLYALGGFAPQTPEGSSQTQGVKKAVKMPGKPVKPAEPPKSPEEIAREKKIERINKKRAALNNTEWEVEVTAEGQEEPMQDLISFKGRKISIKGSIEKGFNPSNYTLTINEDGSLIFETMQRSDEDELSFIKGEISSDIKNMKGIINFPEGNKSTSYYFKSISKRIASP